MNEYRIVLTKGATAVVCEAGYPIVLGKHWHLTSNGYAARRVANGGPYMTRIELMHRAILNPAVGTNVDHINGDRLDNRMCNLRPATQSQNMCNSSIRKDNTSGFRGVWYERRRRAWIAEIMLHGRRKHLGQYRTASEAALAYDIAASEMHGEFASLNYPKEQD